ncbi:hypothetical protein [Flavobacterium sp. 7A]|uniref:hypothetical protein n=1 Tax=Flavobacterium sp. 7A TaxID=2940571 RepID=UPI002225C80A|nr:hypothetical protein [Flavobacterium sp. 7A]MCW2119652.1 putative membrane protein YgcG [Flavobacterium sp. 7A]
MIVYETQFLENQKLIAEAKSLENAGFITKEQRNEVESKLLEFKHQKNIFLRIALCILGSFAYGSICAFISLLGLNTIERNLTVFIYLFAAVGFAGTEFFAKQNIKGQGYDDTFIIGGQLLLAAAVGVTSDGNELLIAIVASIAACLTYLRYLKTISILFFAIASTAIVVFGLFELGSIGKTILPFVLMIYSITLYFICKKVIVKNPFSYYRKGLVWLKYFNLVLFYISGNYFVVRELSVVLLGNEIAPNSDITMAWFFYAFTFLVPLFYISTALKQQNRAMLWIGLATGGFTIFTIRNYYHVLPSAVALTIGGLLVFAIAYFSIKKLKDKTTGITFQPDRFMNTSDFMHTEALLLTSQFGLKPEVAPEASPMEFGGGDFSGGGSGGNF